MITFPIAVSIYNLIGVFKEYQYKRLRNAIWFLTLLIGFFETIFYITIIDVDIEAVWSDQLYNNQIHQPLWTGGLLSISVLCIVGLIGAIILIVCDVNEIPPLLTVLCIASMYLLVIIMAVWCVQMLRHFKDAFPCCVLPVNVMLIVCTIILEKIKQWNQNPVHDAAKYGKNALIKSLNVSLQDAGKWPVYALVGMIPLFGIILVILVLFGQEPDAVIKAWTETTNWTLSGQTGPQNLTYDEHYLCTVAAGGHRKVVKPVRMGVRHGHKVIVNRQLMIANAFENVLEEKTPRFHRVVRDFYDKYGFPVADYIRTNKIACDITYIIMKPLEWLFLAVLYLVDAKPENRIVVQYLPRLNGDK